MACETNTDSQKNCVIHKLVFGTKVQFFEYFRGTSSDFSRRMKLEGCEVQKASLRWEEKSPCDQGSGYWNTFHSNSAIEMGRLWLVQVGGFSSRSAVSVPDSWFLAFHIQHTFILTAFGKLVTCLERFQLWRLGLRTSPQQKDWNHSRLLLKMRDKTSENWKGK